MNCWYIHPSKIENRNEDRTSENGTQRSRYEDNSNNRRNNHPQETQSFQLNNQYSNTHFLGNWPTPAEATPMNIHQSLAKLIGTIQKVDARMEKLERNQMNRWTY